MRLSRTVSYAIQATVQLAELQSDAPVPCSRLAAEGKMPERFLLQILRNLVAHGILYSTRGVDGGYALGRPSHQISILELIEAIDGPLVPLLPMGDALPAKVRTKLERAFTKITDRTRTELDAIKLDDLLKKKSGD